LFADGIPATPEVLNRYNGVLTKFLEGKIEVIGRLSYDMPGPPTILFRPAGDRPRISQIQFTGNESLPTAQLFNTFSGVAVGKEFSEDTVRRLLDLNIRPLYEARGRLRVAFAKIAATPAKEPDVVGVAVDITVEEGSEFKLGNVRYAGAATKQAKELDGLAKWRKDEVVNFDEIKADVDRITRQFKSKGYLHAESRVDRTVNDKEQTVDLSVDVKAGEIYTYGKLDIRGLDLYSEPAVRKAWGAREGKPFDPEGPDAFLKEAQAMFDDLGSTRSETKVNEASRTVDVTLVFAGTKNPGGGRRKLGARP
jgi:outer membrane protein insertion porin family